MANGNFEVIERVEKHEWQTPEEILATMEAAVERYGAHAALDSETCLQVLRQLVAFRKAVRGDPGEPYVLCPLGWTENFLGCADVVYEERILDGEEEDPEATREMLREATQMVSKLRRLVLEAP